MKRLLALLLLAVMSPAFAQMPPIYSPTVEQTYTLTPSQTTSLQNVNQGGTALTLYDDGTTNQPIQLPFNFYYYGNLYDSVYISQNGFISFSSNANGCCSGNQLPFLSQNSYYNLNNSIFAMWSDLADFNTPGNPYYKALSDRFTVGWYGVDELGTANKFTFEITLFDNSNISIAYGDFNYAGPTGRMFTSGIQGDTSDEFWLIYYGNNPSSLEFDTYLFNTSVNLPPPPPPQFLYWNRIAGEYETFTLTEQAVVRYGAEGVYAYQTLEAGTYDCGNSLFGDPIGGVVKSCEFGSNLPPEVVVNCATNPLDPTCIIDDLTDFTDNPILVADENDGSSDGTEIFEEDSTPEEEMFAEEDSFAEELVEEFPAEESLEELLAEESAAEEDELDEEVTTVAAIKEMVNEEKASALSDNISKDVLGAALSVAADAVSAATVAGGESASSSTPSDSSSRSTTLTAAASETVAATTETIAVTESASETVKEESAESSVIAALEILDTGRQLGQEALAVTLALTEATAIESLGEAESVAMVSSSDSVLASMNSIETATAVVTEEQQVVNNETATQTITEETVVSETTEVIVAENTAEVMEQVAVEVELKEEVMVVEVKEQETNEVVKEEVVVAEAQQEETTKEKIVEQETVVAEVQENEINEIVELQEEIVVADISPQQTTETVIEQHEEVIVAETVTETVVENVEQVVADVQTEQPSAVEFTTVEQAMEVFASNVNQQAAAEQEELENSIVQQAIAASQNNEEENKIGFAEAEAITIASDPALANAFNVQPNTASLELLGVLGSRAEEKSDAELRAEQVVAANKEQQDAINANYMDADQSGIVAAIGSDADVSSYLSQRLTDVPFYKPEDIYKNIVYKDNVRGAYFLEKGNTDTYKKMVEEQYKDE